MIKKMSFLCMLMAALAAVMPARAGDKGPDRVSKTAAAYAAVAIVPAGDSERFTPLYLVCNAPAAQTQTIYQVVGGTNTVGGSVTNLLGSLIPAAGARTFTITNAPDFHQDDIFLIVPSGVTSTTNTYWLYGNRWN